MATSALLMAYGATGGDITTGLINWYKFDDGSGTTAHDSGSQGANLALNLFGTGLQSWVAGQVGTGASSFVSSAGQASSFFGSNTVDLSGSSTISLWVLRPSAQANARVNTWGDTAHSLNVQFVLDHSGSEISAASTDGSAFTASASTGAWHWVLMYVTNGVVTSAYLDNVLMTSTYGAGTFGNEPGTGRSYNAKIGGQNSLTSTLDDGRRYTRTLTTADRNLLYAYR